jgi:PEP-CTERM motif
MKTFVMLLLLAVATCPLYADVTLWYNGDFDGVNGLVNQGSGSVDPAYVYDDFTISSGTWTLTGAFSNNLMSLFADSADVEIRSGVSAFNGGTLIYGAYQVDFSQTPTGRGGFNLTEYTIAVDLPNIVLGPGTYWLMVAPSLVGVSFVSTTSGANCVGLPCGTGNNSFFDSVYWGATFNPATDYLYPADFSMGLIGTSSAVPEPSSLIMLGSGLVALAGAARRRFLA